LEGTAVASGACCKVARYISEGIDNESVRERSITFKLAAGLDKYRLVLALEFVKAAFNDDDV
jgi:hypothetical protein